MLLQTDHPQYLGSVLTVWGVTLIVAAINELCWWVGAYWSLLYMATFMIEACYKDGSERRNDCYQSTLQSSTYQQEAAVPELQCWSQRFMVS